MRYVYISHTFINVIYIRVNCVSSININIDMYINTYINVYIYELSQAQ
jgi:hypothetical protein